MITNDEHVEFVFIGRLVAIAVDTNFDSLLRANEVTGLSLQMTIPRTSDPWVCH